MTMRVAGQKDGELWVEGLKEKFLVVRRCLWIVNPWIWDIVLISHVQFLCHTVYFRKELCHCLGENGLISLSLMVRNLAGQL